MEVTREDKGLQPLKCLSGLCETWLKQSHFHKMSSQTINLGTGSLFCGLQIGTISKLRFYCLHNKDLKVKTRTECSGNMIFKLLSGKSETHDSCCPCTMLGAHRAIRPLKFLSLEKCNIYSPNADFRSLLFSMSCWFAIVRMLRFVQFDNEIHKITSMDCMPGKSGVQFISDIS